MSCFLINSGIRLQYENDKPNIWLQSPVNSGANLKFLPFCRSPVACLFSSWPESSSKALSKLISCRVTSLSSSSLSVTEYKRDNITILFPVLTQGHHSLCSVINNNILMEIWVGKRPECDQSDKLCTSWLGKWVGEKNVTRGYDVRTSRTKKQIFYRQALRNILSDNLCSSFPSFLLLVRSSRGCAAFSGPAHVISSSPDKRILV